MYSGVYTRGTILPNTSKMAAWGNKQKSVKKRLFPTVEVVKDKARCSLFIREVALFSLRAILTK